ncbi:DUF1592 domain-containing protein [Thalassoglobus sp. JC818]|uniref:DUF1592 domain-containing protein n=1 Tax=Thalassoglobus sp. JC818 TaxID=3232136 RepID=UPI0034595F3D
MSLINRILSWCTVVAFCCVIAFPALADEGLIKIHCGKCHSGTEPKGDFSIHNLGSHPEKSSIDLWTASLDRVKAGEMPPAKKSQLASGDRERLVEYLSDRVRGYSASSERTLRVSPRRINNREFRNSVRDALLIEDVGTHQPTYNLIGDSLHEGFDTHGETLGFSNFHLEQYIESLRRIVDATILNGEQPKSKLYQINSREILSAHTSQNVKRPERRGKRDGFEFLDPKELAYFEKFPVVPTTGWYKISIRCTGLDRGYYEAEKTGIYDDDPIRLTVAMGNRERTYDLPDNEVVEIELTEWLAAGTRLRFRYPTDGLTLRSNGNFKFQNAIAGEYIKEHDPELYQQVADSIVTKPGRRILKPESWHHWVEYWRGPRPRIDSATVEGPLFNSWPPRRQVALIGDNPKAEDAASILQPIAERAWRREVRNGELAPFVQLVQSKRQSLGDVEALKEGIIAILASPPFLLLNTDDLTPQERFAAKLNYFLQSTIPDHELREAAEAGKLESFDGVYAEVERQLNSAQSDPFLRAFPFAWLKLNDINFMAPDPDRYPHYHRKKVSEDMIEETLAFFRYVVEEDLPVTEFISANYSFINADLAVVYEIDDAPQDSKFRKYTFSDGRRGGLLGMGAFHTVTADSLGTSPIHRAIYVMENFLAIHPSPPPADVDIQEPDIRSAKTIREVLEAHRSDKTCAACHQSIDPFGWAFENFDPMGSWRDTYDDPTMEVVSKRKQQKRVQETGIPIDASASFLSGAEYHDIVGFRELMQTEANRDRFVRCFVTKLLTYANGEEPSDYNEIEKIVAKSAEHDYRIVATIAAVIDSPLFRETSR